MRGSSWCSARWKGSILTCSKHWNEATAHYKNPYCTLQTSILCTQQYIVYTVNPPLVCPARAAWTRPGWAGSALAAGSPAPDTPDHWGVERVEYRVEYSVYSVECASVCVHFLPNCPVSGNTNSTALFAKFVIPFWSTSQKNTNFPKCHSAPCEKEAFIFFKWDFLARRASGWKMNF